MRTSPQDEEKDATVSESLARLPEKEDGLPLVYGRLLEALHNLVGDNTTGISVSRESDSGHGRCGRRPARAPSPAPPSASLSGRKPPPSSHGRRRGPQGPGSRGTSLSSGSGAGGSSAGRRKESPTTSRRSSAMRGLRFLCPALFGGDRPGLSCMMHNRGNAGIRRSPGLLAG